MKTRFRVIDMDDEFGMWVQYSSFDYVKHQVVSYIMMQYPHFKCVKPLISLCDFTSLSFEQPPVIAHHVIYVRFLLETMLKITLALNWLHFSQIIDKKKLDISYRMLSTTSNKTTSYTEFTL